MMQRRSVLKVSHGKSHFLRIMATLRNASTGGATDRTGWVKRVQLLQGGRTISSMTSLSVMFRGGLTGVKEPMKIINTH